jgi:hypothetical protein
MNFKPGDLLILRYPEKHQYIMERGQLEFLKGNVYLYLKEQKSSAIQNCIFVEGIYWSINKNCFELFVPSKVEKIVYNQQIKELK